MTACPRFFEALATSTAFVACSIAMLLSPASSATAAETTPVSFHKQVRPILQAHCQGCHQPAKPQGDYVMTTFAELLKGGESESPAIVPGKPDESYLIEEVTPIDGQAEMPKGKKPLSEAEIDLLRRWIAEGAKDDSPASTVNYDKNHPPRYARAPVVPSIDFSPNGDLLAVAGFHEVLLADPQSGKLTGRLIGVSERIQSVRFSPDGGRLLVTGGLPGRLGEVQIWDVAKRELALSISVTFDTVYGGSWSSDGKLVAVGCADNTLRAYSSETGEQVLFQGAHNDWVLDTVFSKDNSHLMSVGRDMTVKLTEVATERFVDNVTSITPGALKGGINAIARHPSRDEVVIGGSDGAPKVYRVFRETKRVIGDDANLIRIMPTMKGRVFAVAVSPDGKWIAAGSSLNGTGEVRVYSYEFDTTTPNNIKGINQKVVTQRSAAEKKTLADYHKKDVKQISMASFQAAVYSVKFAPDGKALAAAGSDGIVRILNPETGELIRELSPAPVDQAQSEAAGLDAADFILDVNPVLSRLGCNQGTCHGSAKGKNGFKLSLRGYDAIFDVRALTDDLSSRRVNVASPDDSLMLLKPTGAVPHEGGVMLSQDDKYYDLIRRWIASGAKLNTGVPRVASISVEPKNPVVQALGSKQQVKVIATYSDGKTRDVTREAFIESGNTEVAETDGKGLMTAVRRGEAPILARYEGAYSATTMTVMGDREGFRWEDVETYNFIDELVKQKWQRVKIIPSELATDAEFLRRVYLDLTGLPPSSEQVKSFLDDKRPSREKRNAVIDQLIGSDAFIDHWTNKWADMLQVNRKYLGAPGATAFRAWIRERIAANTPYDEFARTLLTSNGSNKDNPAASYYKILREPDAIMENTTHLFMAVRFNCNKCHDHPFERWTQDQYYQTAAFFARVGLKADPKGGKGRIGGTAVEGAKPLYEIVYEKPEGEVVHNRTQAVTPPEFPFEAQFEAAESASRREKLAAWITSPDNQYFAKSYVNRLWGYLTGVGLIEPIDDIRAGNPPTNPELLDKLTREFIDSGFDARHMMRLICQSRTYQLSIKTNRWNEDDAINYSHAKARRLPAEVLFDSIHQVLGATPRIPGVAAGTRAAQLPDAGIKLPSAFLANLGRPARESACECERSSELRLGPIMALISGPTVGNALADPNNAVAKLVTSEKDDDKLVDELFLRILNRPATESEKSTARHLLAELPQEHQQLVGRLKELEAKHKPELDRLTAQRQANVDQATASLQKYEATVADREAKLDKQHAEKLASATDALKQFDSDFAKHFATWEKERQRPLGWHVVQAKALKASNKAKLEQADDGSIFVSGPNGKGNYQITADVTLEKVTGIRLELLADDRLPAKGPGRAQNGNYVLSELKVEHAPSTDPNAKSAVKLQNAKADFSQNGYDVATAIDGKIAPTGNGWAGSPQLGVNHTATFETAADLTAGQITFVLDQQFQDGMHTLGKFRLAVTNAARPIGLDSLPKEITDLLAVTSDKRSPAQVKKLHDYFRKVSGQRNRLAKQLEAAKQPRTIDPKLVELRKALDMAKTPVPIPRDLEHLRAIVALSDKQLKNARLTAAQDIAWALLNNPAFLFNR